MPKGIRVAMTVDALAVKLSCFGASRGASISNTLSLGRLLLYTKNNLK